MEQILREVSPGPVILRECDGKETISNSGLFKTEFCNGWEERSFSKPTPQVGVKVFEMTRNSTFHEMFCSLLKDETKLKKLSLTENQIVVFCRTSREWLRNENYGTFFPMKRNGQFFVAHVKVDSDGIMSLKVNRFGRSRMWHGRHLRRIVVPVVH